MTAVLGDDRSWCGKGQEARTETFLTPLQHYLPVFQQEWATCQHLRLLSDWTGWPQADADPITGLCGKRCSSARNNQRSAGFQRNSAIQFGAIVLVDRESILHRDGLLLAA
ncbi:MAG: Uncharacterised protein [Cyanobium sp. ARS6]|nr:MAG: Uncharacterised protein [Cyanobium sp. ARS6]